MAGPHASYAPVNGAYLNPSVPSLESSPSTQATDIELAVNKHVTVVGEEPALPVDNYTVTWTTPTDPENPKDWSMTRRVVATLLVSVFVFLSPVASSMIAPALPSVADDLDLHSSAETALTMSIFLLAYAIGPLLAGPLSELYGRVPVLQLSNLWFIAFNLGCGFARTGPQLIVCRFFAGLGGAAPLSIGAGVVSDCWPAEQRGRAIAVYSLAPLAGPAVGPIAGAWIAERTTWRWVFWATTIFSVTVQALGAVSLRETYAPILLERRVRRLVEQTGDPAWHVAGTDPAVPPPSRRQRLATAVARPFVMLTTQPIVIVIALYMAYVYGTTYLVLSSLATVFTSPESYDMPVGLAGLNYLALAAGYICGAEANARVNDRVYAHLKSRDPRGEGRPESRAVAMTTCAVLLPVGFLWYGWTAETRQHWILPDVGAFLIGVGTIAGIQSMQAYLVDAYTRFAASAMAAALVLRSLAAFAFPLFAPALYARLGYGWGNSLLAGVALVVGVPAPWLLWRFGARLRSISRFAAG